MINSCFFRSVLVSFIIIFHAFAAEHTDNGTNYGDKGIEIYDQMRHGPDGFLFLDPYFIPYLLNLKGQVLLDAGCGSGPWSIVAAKNGALVYGIDIQEGMIEKAKQSAKDAGVENVTNFSVGDVGDLPYPNGFFDRAISINVGCNLPNIELHIKEFQRVLKKGGVAVLTAPHTFDVVFTNGNKSYEETIRNIQKLIFDHKNSFSQLLPHLDDIYRATFINKQNNWVLVLNEVELSPGDKIWRKIPMMVVPNHYHSEQEYKNLFLQYGFKIKAIHHPKFSDESERENYNENHSLKLGKEYLSSSPFVIFIVEKM